MEQQDKHTFDYNGTWSGGEDEYYCPTCGRHILLQMNPYKKTVLAVGDDYAIHSGGKGGLSMNAEIKDNYLEPFEKYMDGRGER